MASPNLELVRSICAGWARGDFSTADWADPEIVFAFPDGPDPGEWVGKAAMAERWRSRLSAWTDFRQEAYDYRALEAGRVLVRFRTAGRGKASGVDFEPRHMSVALFEIRDGKVVRLAAYFNADNALADLGLTADRDGPAQ